MSLSKTKLFSFLMIGLFLGAGVVPGINGDINENEAIQDNVNVLSFQNGDKLDQYQHKYEYAGSPQYPWWGQSLFYTNSNDYQFWCQSFKPSLSTLTRVKLWLFEAWEDNCMDCDFKFSIRDGLYGADLITMYKSAEEIPYYNYADWVEFDFQDITVIPEKTYYIICETSCGYFIDSVTGCLWGWLFDDHNPYSRGSSYYRHSSTTWYTDSSDTCFETYGYGGGNQPVIEIDQINGGFGVSSTIKNTGTAFATDLAWSINVTGGIILSGSHTEDIIGELAVGASTTIKAKPRGIGRITITVQADDEVKQASAFLLGPLVLRVTQ